MRIVAKFACLSLLALFIGACSDTPQPPEEVAKAYLTSISEGDTNAIHYIKYYAQKEAITLADQEKIQTTILPARFDALKRGGLQEVVIDDIEFLQSDLVRIHYSLIFYKKNEVQKGTLMLEDDRGWLVIGE